MTTDNKCHCVVKHPDNEDERQAIVESLRRAREQGDNTGIVIAMAQLTGECKSHPKKAYHYLVVMKHCWGRGASIEEAEKNARKAGSLGRGKQARIVYQYDPEKTENPHIDEMGMNMVYTGDKPVEIERTAPPKRRR